jgi:hypothetical protein
MGHGANGSGQSLEGFRTLHAEEMQAFVLIATPKFARIPPPKLWSRRAATPFPRLLPFLPSRELSRYHPDAPDTPGTFYAERHGQFLVK